VFAEIPGLIEGAAGGAGLGHDFLRHIERTRLLVHLLDAAPDNGKQPAENYRAIREELAAYSPELADKPEIIALNKVELVPDQKDRAKMLKELSRASGARLDKDVFAVSGATKEGLPALLERLWKELHPASKGELAGWKG
jgi:GTP-binding protein